MLSFNQIEKRITANLEAMERLRFSRKTAQAWQYYGAILEDFDVCGTPFGGDFKKRVETAVSAVTNEAPPVLALPTEAAWQHMQKFTPLTEAQKQALAAGEKLEAVARHREAVAEAEVETKAGDAGDAEVDFNPVTVAE